MRLAAPVIAGLALLLGCISVAHARPSSTTPELITAAVERGEVGNARGQLLRAYAFARPDRLPRAYRSSVPWDGTLVLLDLKRAVRKMEPGDTRREIEAMLEPGTTANADCSSSSGSLSFDVQTDHFWVEYDTIGAGLDIGDYTASLETAWNAQVTSFGWAAPPVGAAPAPGSKYHVRIDDLGSGLYGFVSNSGTHAGLVGNNPNTPWSDGDAHASCMVLNSDYTGFASSPQASLDSTTAHEFNHSLQFGYGALHGANEPDDAFVEGGATWMEDEVFDSANDNYFYLWPVFSDGMGEYNGSPYPYWITFRGITERYGTGVAGGGEDVMQRFWELTSQNLGDSLGAMDDALAAEGTTLADAFHAYAVAVRFTKTCGGSHSLPYCFEEAAGYVAQAGAVSNTTAISAVGGGTTGQGVVSEDHYSIQYVGLPTTGGVYSVKLENRASAGGPGQLRGTVVCNRGSELDLFALPSIVEDGTSEMLASFDPTGCTSVVLVVTNQTHTSDDPATSTTRRFAVSTASTAPPPDQTLTVATSGDGAGTVTGTGISCPGDCSETYASGTVVSLTAAPSAGSTFSGWSGACTGTGTTCQVTMSQARNVTAAFQLPKTLTVAKSGDGSGSVSSSPTGISCGSDCSETYTFDTVVTLTAGADSGSTFAGWSGGCSGSATTCQVTMNQVRSVTARFEGPRTLTVAKTGAGAGAVTSASPGIDCGNVCAADLAYGSVVTLTATPAAGSQFSGWSGACSGAGSCQVTMTEARSVTATFSVAADPGTSDPPPPTQPPPTTQPPPQPTPTQPADEPDDNPIVPELPAPFVPLADTTAPRVSVSTDPLRASKRGYVRLPIACPVNEFAGCVGTLRLRLLRRTNADAAARTVGKASFRIAAGETKRVRLRLTRFARQRLADRGRIRVRAVVVVVDAAGNTRTVRRKLTVRGA